MTAYQQCVLNATGRCVRWSHQHRAEALPAENDAHRDWVTADGHLCIGGDCPGCAAALAPKECVICGRLGRHGGLCCAHRYDEQPACDECDSA